MLHTTLSALLFRWWYYTGGGSRDLMGGEFALICIFAIIFMMLIYYNVTKRIERRAMPGGKPIKITEPLSAAHRSILSEKSDYYNQLGKPDKELFEKRVRYYMTSKMFTSEDGYAVTDEMKVMISVAASQIIFGLPAVANSNFTHILIMPNGDMPPRTASRNTIVIPWREFVNGYAKSDDGQNEGLKVMATAFARDNRLQDKAYKIFPVKKYENWEKVSLQEAGNFMGGMYENMETDDRLRDEYFAMAIVYFFELPVAFKQKYPALFEAMSALLNQDTVKKTVKK